MSADLEILQTKAQQLPPQKLSEVIAFIDKLLAEAAPAKPRPRMKFSWAGALADLRDQYTSLELQEEANQIRIENQMKVLRELHGEPNDESAGR